MSEIETKNDEQEKKWKRFENLVYEIQKSFSGTTATVTHKEYIMGMDSKVEREIDISIKQQVAQFPILVVIDCKDYAEPVDVKSVEEFAGLAEDVRAGAPGLRCRAYLSSIRIGMSISNRGAPGLATFARPGKLTAKVVPGQLGKRACATSWPGFRRGAYAPVEVLRSRVQPRLL